MSHLRGRRELGGGRVAWAFILFFICGDEGVISQFVAP